MSMNTQALVMEKLIDAPVAMVWGALTDIAQMKKWYFDIDAFRPEVGMRFSFEGCGHEGEKYLHLCEVTEAVAGKKIAYTWRYDKHPGESLVTFELEPEGDKTRLKLTHAGLETFDSSNPDFARSSFEGGWNELIGVSLVAYLAR